MCDRNTPRVGLLSVSLSSKWRVLSTLAPVLSAVFSRDVCEDIDGRIAKSASESKPGRIDKTMHDRISFHSDLNWLECLYETNKPKFKLGSHQGQCVQLKENL